jgi:hypothetical protein
MKHKVESFEFVDHGIEHEQYFQGCGSGSFDAVYTGIGNSLKEAMEDATNQAFCSDLSFPPDVEKDIDREISEADDKFTVTGLAATNCAGEKHEVADDEPVCEACAERWESNQYYASIRVKLVDPDDEKRAAEDQRVDAYIEDRAEERSKK